MNIGIFIFDDLTQLDATGPFEVLARLPGARMILVAKRRRAITAGYGMKIVPHVGIRECPKLDILVIPGGSGINAFLLDEEVIAFVRQQARTARYVTSVCTGALLLAAAGLLRGRRATTHWFSVPLLASFGAKPSQQRVVWDGKFITAGGVTSGIDFGLQLAAKIAGAKAAREIQLMLQYDPQPPFRAGTPRQAGKRLVAAFTRHALPGQRARAGIAARAAELSLARRG